jgi:predicted phosphoribosyltransferase
MDFIDPFPPQRAIFRDRLEAGERLAAELDAYRREQPLVLGLPRGGVPVAAIVARALGAPLDVLVARKIGAPGHEELALGAVAPGGVEVFDDDLVDFLGLSPEQCEELARRARAEMGRRIERFRGADAPELPDVRDRTVILVDDGLATGATAQAGIRALRKAGARRVVLAAGVGPPETARALRAEADEVVCLVTPEPFYAVGLWFRHFDQVTDDEVADLLRAGSPPTTEPSTG